MVLDHIKLFLDAVFQKYKPDESGKHSTEDRKVLEPSCSAGKIEIKAKGCKKYEKQSLKYIFSSGAHCYTPP